MANYRWTMDDLRKTRVGRLTDVFPSLPTPAPKKPAKYRNAKVIDDATGAVHDSTKEFHRWQELALRERAGEISQLRRQVPFACVVEGEHVFDYVADFVYREGAALIVEDTKPKDPKYRKTAAYRLFRAKQKVAQALHKFQIREV